MHRRFIGAGLVLAVATALAGCSSATDTGSGSAQSADLTAAQQKCVDAVTKDVESAKAVQDLVAPTAPLDLAALKGTTIWYITVTMNQFSSDMYVGVQAAAKAAGIEVRSFDGQGQANRFNDGIEQAIAQKAGGIILVGIQPSVVAASLADAAAAGIPVQNTLNGDPDDAVPANEYGNFTSAFSENGTQEADWALMDSGCRADTVILDSSSIVVWKAMGDAATKEFAVRCPECKVQVLDIDVANVSTDIGSKLQAALQKDPAVDYIYPVWDSGVPFVTPVVSAAGSKARVLSRDGLAANLKNIKDGTQAMTVAMPPTDWIGWAAFDDLARKITGAKLPGYVIPTRMIDSSNIGDGSSDATWPKYKDFPKAFTDAWAGK